MTLNEVGVVIFEIAAGVLVQATRVGGPVAAGGAGVVVIATLAFLLARERRVPLSVRIDRFLAERRATEPLGEDEDLRLEYETDTVDCYRSVFAHELRLVTQKLLKDGVIGRNEALTWTRSATIGDIERIVERLSQYETRR